MAKVDVSELGNPQNLSSTIQINGGWYNVTAEEAGKVKNSLIIYKYNKEGATSAFDCNSESFDGSKGGVVISYVPASGGNFTGPIKVPSTDISNTNNIDGQTVLNWGDLAGISTQLTGAGWYSWKNYILSVVKQNDVPQQLGLVTGSDSDVVSFALENFYEKRLPCYLYICLDSGNIYYGTSENTTCYKLARQADSADTTDSLSIPLQLQVNLASQSVGTFNGTDEKLVTPGVYGVLDIKNGGTGAANAASACDKLIKNQSISPKDVVTKESLQWAADAKHDGGDFGINLKDSDVVGAHGIWLKDYCNTRGQGLNFPRNTGYGQNGNYDRLFVSDGKIQLSANESLDHTTAANNNVYEVFHEGMTKAIPEKNGGTGKSALSDVSVGHAKTITTYMSTSTGTSGTYGTKTKIILSKNAPDDAKDGNEGDIWIQYSTT